MSSTRLITLHLPPGKLGVDIQEATDGIFQVVRKNNAASLLEVGDVILDIILSLDGNTITLREQPEWAKRIMASSQECETRTMVVRRIANDVAKDPTASDVSRCNCNPPAMGVGKFVTSIPVARAIPMQETSISSTDTATNTNAGVGERSGAEGGMPSSSENPSSVMVRLLDTTMAKANSLEIQLKQSNESYQALEAEMNDMKCELGCLKGMLEEEKQLNRNANEKVKELEYDVIAKSNSKGKIQEECDSFRRQLDEMKQSKEDLSKSYEDLLQTQMSHSDQLERDLSTAKDTEAMLRKRISLLMHQKNDIQECNSNSNSDTLVHILQDEVNEQLGAIDSLVDLLERQRRDHTKEVADKDDQIALLKKQLYDIRGV